MLSHVAVWTYVMDHVVSCYCCHTLLSMLAFCWYYLEFILVITCCCSSLIIDLEWPQWCIIIDHWCCRSLPPARITCRSNGRRSCFIGTIWSTSNMDWRGTNTNNKTDRTDAFQFLFLTRSNWYTTQKLLASWKSSQHQANFYLVPN